MLKLVRAFGRWQSKLDSAALTLGLVGNICLAFLFFPVSRGSSLLPLFGLTTENSIKYHIWLGNITMTLFTAHGICFIIYWAVTNELSQVIKNLFMKHSCISSFFSFFLITKDIHFFYGVRVWKFWERGEQRAWDWRRCNGRKNSFVFSCWNNLKIR